MTDRANDDNGRYQVVASVANDALEQLECSREHARWMASLCKAIRVGLETGDDHDAKHLAGLAQYLADNQWSALNDHIGRANERMNGIGSRS